VDFVRRELLGYDTHLPQDVVLAYTLGECRELAFNVG
jgi:hypothetical protein